MSARSRAKMNNIAGELRTRSEQTRSARASPPLGARCRPGCGAPIHRPDDPLISVPGPTIARLIACRGCSAGRCIHHVDAVVPSAGSGAGSINSAKIELGSAGPKRRASSRTFDAATTTAATVNIDCSGSGCSGSSWLASQGEVGRRSACAGSSCA